jgi:flavin reductase (DIM6/NTAB) family NADH-FMN oxidoreductase RutF
MATTDEIKKALGRPIGRIASGVYILTANHQGTRAAMLASWVQQAGFDPPALTIALAKQRPIGDMIRGSGSFGLSILAADDTTLMKKYARGIPPDQDPFEGMNTLQTPAGQTVLADALAWIECSVLNFFEYGGDHEILVARITAAAILKEGQPFTHVRGNGFHY